MRREDLTKRLRRAGIPLSEAATAARVAINAHKRDRDALIVRARTVLSLRATGALFGLSHEHIRRIWALSPLPRSDVTPK